ncbi:CxC2 domain-containing protein [Mycena sanguinolenta]|uniref:CxC2 domain-containing protein n=1 Tax=Mycena sanguinolenta TaxID=230812 RepID=A0A8H6X4I1_9AGAR|nr:CxC2 domain-containing protein [Mycena sanguinolenta]
MKRLSEAPGGPLKKRPKNIFSLNAFGHSLKPSQAAVARTGNLSADGHRADVELIALSSQATRPAVSDASAAPYDDDDWLDFHGHSDQAAGDTAVPTEASRMHRRKWMTTLRLGSTIIGTLICAFSLLTRDLWARKAFAHAGSLPGCMVERHRLRPLCRIERWNGAFFDKRELRHLGLRVQLGHRDNTPCSCALPARRKFVVVAPNGFHYVALDFCKCCLSGHQPHWEQLLAYGWYPATPDAPRSAVTISTLKLFHAVSLQGKTTAYHFFHALAKTTDNTGSKGFKMSTCTGLAALDHANTKYAQGYAATGCGMVTCGRHEVVCKNGVGDLQKGEKYGNMDYVVTSVWQHLRTLLFFLLSYDIMCQWSKSLGERLLKRLPPALRFEIARYFVKFMIPKLHILGHLKLCQETYSLLFTLGAAQSDMEGIERIWSSSGLMGASTREMGPGSRQDTLDDFWHYWNWGKVVGMGETLRKQLLKATKELSRQLAGLQEFNQEQEDQIDAWKKAVDKFEVGLSKKNPYELPWSGPTLRNIELELAREEQERERASTVARSTSEETMTEYLMLGLEIEGQQRQLAVDLLANRSPTSKQLTEFVMRRMRISREIKKLRLLQCKYSPAATYRHARRARVALEEVAGVCGWRTLEPADLQMMEDEEEAKRRTQRAMKGKQKETAQENEYGEGGREESWGEEMYEGVKVEWCKAYARVKRWREEVLLLQEEMVRCLRTLEWQAKIWDGRAAAEHYNGKVAYAPAHLEGARAYAARQAAVRRTLAARFRRLWWKLTNCIGGESVATSSESSGAEEEDEGKGDEDDRSDAEEDVQEGPASEGEHVQAGREEHVAGMGEEGRGDEQAGTSIEESRDG